MSETLRRIVELVRSGDVWVSAHGYEALSEDGILAREAIEGVEAGVVVEDYPDYPKGRVSSFCNGIGREARFT